MSRPAALLTLLLAASCAPNMVPLSSTSTASPPTITQGTVCRVAANGGPILAERGIGGTGISSDEPRWAERGIGGTGIGTQIPQSVVRGLTDISASTKRPDAAKLGDAGIVGVITGFDSVCVDGLEIALDGAVPMQIDGSSASGTALRAGQVAVIEAAMDNGVMRSLHLAIRHEVAGPIERLDSASGAMTVAGQPVIVSAETWNVGQFSVGDWVSVSGLRRPDGSIRATRLDLASKGLVSIRGRVFAQDNKLRIGSVILMSPPDTRVGAGKFVAVSGHYTAGVLRTEKVDSDLLEQDPVAFFGGSINRIIERSVMRFDSGRVWLGGTLPVPLAPGVASSDDGQVDAVVTLDRGADQTFSVTRVDAPTPTPAR